MSTEKHAPHLFEIEDACRVYPMGEVEVWALQHTQLTIREGEFLVIVGPSGSGKSTLLNLIGGMDRPTTGSIRFRGRDLARLSDHELTMFRRHEVGFVFQTFNLVPSLTALENVQVATEIATDPLDPLETLERVDMKDRAHHFPSQLSGGQQQRVAIARALASNPGLLLCDEPTGALDTTTGMQVMQLLLDLNRTLGKTVIVITHDPSIATLGTRVARMRDGHIESLEETAHRNEGDPC